ncbi:metal-dependent hydrolase [Streptomyces sp. NPDC000927]|uniref:metal-dependent hydrolase n=1 Tax=Streptomyces sp. NPDC000927 TaxID=3154371 RepID=UPI003333A430
MRGKTHAVIGAAAPFGAAAHGVNLTQCVAMAVISAGFSLGPDIDHPKSTISQALPHVAHRTMHGLSGAARIISTERDRRDFAFWARPRMDSAPRDANHRTVTHTLVSALAVGIIATAVSLVPHGSVLLAAFAAFIARRLMPRCIRDRRLTANPASRGDGPSGNSCVGRLPKWSLVVPAVAGAAAWMADLHPVLAGSAAGLGWLSHVIADGCTKFGVPLMWPLKVRGKRWWRFRFLGSRLECGASGEWLAASGVAAIFVAVPYIF